jgi:hypothetical protein
VTYSKVNALTLSPRLFYLLLHSKGVLPLQLLPLNMDITEGFSLESAVIEGEWERAAG